MEPKRDEVVMEEQKIDGNCNNHSNWCRSGGY
ncbi:hypothetical protein SOVF_089950, partial [Spinacia oleracea]